jgi:CheY-like chemotaxis protein
MSLKVLVAEEDPATLDMMREVLTSNGISSVIVINDSQQAAIVINQEKFDAAITDLMMKKLDGFEFIRQIRQSSWNPKIPVIIVSSNGDTETRTEAFEAGATFFLQKPVERVDLNRLLRTTRGAMVEEKRRATRCPLVTEVSCTVESRDLTGLSSNLSREGILFQADGSLRRGSVVVLSFCLERNKPAVKLTGVVVRADEKKQAAVRFVPVQTDDLQRVRDFIARKVDGA